MFTRDAEFNPNKPHYLATAGDDCRIKFWDTRNVKAPLKEINTHTHWYF